MITQFIFTGIVFALANDWPQYNGADHNRCVQGLEIAPWDHLGPEVSWKIDTPLGFSSFTIGEGAAFTLVSDGERDQMLEVVVCLSADSGKELWRKNLSPASYDGGAGSGTPENNGGDGPRSTPSYADGRVFVLDAHLNLYAFEAKTGEALWIKDIVKEHQGRNIRWQNAASPLVVDDNVLVAGGGTGEALLAFDCETGKLSWSGEDDLMTHATPILANIHATLQAIFFTQKGLVSVRPDTGDILWRADFPYKVSSAASPVVYEDIVYCSAGYGVGAGAFKISHANGEWKSELLWRKANKLINHWSTPTCVDGFLYGMFSFKKYGTGPIQCIDIRNGETMWSQDGYGPGNCIALGDKILALGDDGQVVLVEATPEAYEELSRSDVLEGKCWSSPSYSDGNLYVRSTTQGACIRMTPGS